VVLSARPETGIVIPRSALRNGQVLIAGDDNRLALLPVKPLLVQNAIALITQGLEEGQRVVVMRLLRAGIDTSVIALWLGHEQIETTQIYLHADLQIKERALERTAPITTKPGRFRPTDKLLAFLEAL
jgi:hypothetical protein